MGLEFREVEVRIAALIARRCVLLYKQWCYAHMENGRGTCTERETGILLSYSCRIKGKFWKCNTKRMSHNATIGPDRTTLHRDKPSFTCEKWLNSYLYHPQWLYEDHSVLRKSGGNLLHNAALERFCLGLFQFLPPVPQNSWSAAQISSLLRIWNVFYFSAVFPPCLFIYLTFAFPNAFSVLQVFLPVAFGMVAISLFLVLAPIVWSPKVQYIYASIFMLGGLLLYVPFVHFKIHFAFIDKITCYLQLLLEVSPPHYKSE